MLITSGAIPELEEEFRTYGIEIGGKLAFNGTLNGALKDPIVSGHTELGSLVMNGRDLGSLVANISSTAAETRISEGHLAQANGGGASRRPCQGDQASVRAFVGGCRSTGTR